MGSLENWIDNFEPTFAEYEPFYKHDNKSVKIWYIYVNNALEVERTSKEVFVFEKENLLSEEELVRTLVKNRSDGTKTYTVLNALRYNIDLDPVDVRQFLNEDSAVTSLDVLTSLAPIKFAQTIRMFQDINTIFIIFYENATHAKTRRIRIHNSSPRTMSKRPNMTFTQGT